MRLSFNGKYVMSQDFGVYDPTAYANYPGMKHPGTDWALPPNTQLVAGMAGKVTVYRRTGTIGRGNEVVITNGDKQRKTCHMNVVSVSPGQWVNEGDPIGASGYTGYVVDAEGRVGTPQGAHLHDELLIDGTYVPVREHLEEENSMTKQEATALLDEFFWKFTNRKVKQSELDEYVPLLLEGKYKQAFEKFAKFDEVKEFVGTKGQAKPLEPGIYKVG